MSTEKPKRINRKWILSVVVMVSGQFAIAEQTAAERPDLKFTFEKVKRLPLGSSQLEASTIFGSPSKVFKEKRSGKILWVYVEGTDILRRRQRLGLSFSGNSQKLSGIYYSPGPTDSVALVSGLKTEFPKVQFKTVEPSNCGEHFTLNEGFDYDLAQGITFEKDETDRVSNLRFVEPLTEAQRKAASEPTGCPDKNERRAEFAEITPALK